MYRDFNLFFLLSILEIQNLQNQFIFEFLISLSGK
jgi:hypothetical protein